MVIAHLENGCRPSGQCKSGSAPLPPYAFWRPSAAGGAPRALERVAGTRLSGRTRVETVSWDGAPVRVGRVDPAPLFPGGPAPIEILAVAETELPDVGQLERRFEFTRREAEVALLLMRRRTNKEIARALNVTTHTAKRHVEGVLAKLRVNSRRHVLAVLIDSFAGVATRVAGARPAGW